MSDSLSTISDFIRYTHSRLDAEQTFFGHGTDNSLDEAYQLVLQTLNLPWDFDIENESRLLSVKEKTSLVENVKARIGQRLPLAYLTKQAWFCGHQFYVDERVLVPRSPIGELINNQFLPWRAGSEPERIMDLCAGSGCIGISCALEFHRAKIDLLELSEEALQVAKINVDRFGLEQRVRLIFSDVFESIGQELEGSYDIIVSNPPYVNAIDFQTMPEEFRKEPLMGLVAGEDGLTIARRILADSARFLKKNGILVIEVGNSWEALENAYPDFPFTWIEFEHGGHGVCVISASELKSRVW